MTTLREKLKEVYYKEFDKDGHVAVDTTFENVLAFISSECERARGEAIKECIEVAKSSKATFFGTKDSAEPPLEEVLYELKAEIVTNLERLLLASLTHTKL